MTPILGIGVASYAGMRCLLLLLLATNALASDLSDIRGLALANGFNPSERVLMAIVAAPTLPDTSARVNRYRYP